AFGVDAVFLAPLVVGLLDLGRLGLAHLGRLRGLARLRGRRGGRGGRRRGRGLGVRDPGRDERERREQRGEEGGGTPQLRDRRVHPGLLSTQTRLDWWTRRGPVGHATRRERGQTPCPARGQAGGARREANRAATSAEWR